MDEQNNKNLYCSCTDDCCPPKRENKWKKALFFLIILAAISIVFVRFTSESKGKAQVLNDSVSYQQPVGIDTSTIMNCSKTCDPTKNSSCCPQIKK